MFLMVLALCILTSLLSLARRHGFDLIVYGSAQFGAGMWYLREDGRRRARFDYFETRLL